MSECNLYVCVAYEKASSQLNNSHKHHKRGLKSLIMHKEKCLTESEFDQNVADGENKCKIQTTLATQSKVPFYTHLFFILASQN